ncbi:MAG: ABC transporter ATP-binding protein [Desulfovibrionaceae bacterium]
MENALITIEKIKKNFTQAENITHILKGISFTVKKGELLAIVGGSGSGKSTLLYILGLLDKPTSGKYTFAEHNTANLDDITLSHIRNQLIGFVFQSFYLIPYATALENVMLPGIYAKEHNPQGRERAQMLLEQVGLQDRMSYIPQKLSGGQQQRIAIARALFNRPAMLLADEPTGQLDTKTSEEILELFSTINASGTTVILVTHDKKTSLLARRIITLEDGLIQSDSQQ